MTFIQSQEARRFSQSLKRLWIYLIDNLITGEHSVRVERDRGNKRNERKPACCRGYICWKDLLACQPGAFTPFKDTHSLSHTVTQWTRGHSSTCQSKQREERKYNCASQQTVLLQSWPAQSKHKIFYSQWVNDGTVSCAHFCTHLIYSFTRNAYFHFIYFVCSLDYSKV